MGNQKPTREQVKAIREALKAALPAAQGTGHGC